METSSRAIRPQICAFRSKFHKKFRENALKIALDKNFTGYLSPETPYLAHLK